MRAIGVLIWASRLLMAPISRGNPRNPVLHARSHGAMSKYCQGRESWGRSSGLRLAKPDTWSSGPVSAKT